MGQGKYQFPDGFIWGSVTSSHQVEGNNLNNTWSTWESETGHIKNDDHAGNACGWWDGKWQEDLDRAAAAGQNAHRFSVEWSRVQPSPGQFDQAALDFYRQLAKGMLERGITPMVTLHHFTDPAWLAEKGGWEDEGIVQLFSQYVRRVAVALQEFLNLWVTINEPNYYTFNGYFEGKFPPGKTDLDCGYNVLSNMVRAHAAAYQIIHEIQPQAQVGYAIHYKDYQPATTWNPLDKWVQRIRNNIYNEAFPQTIATGRFNFVYAKEKIPEAFKTQDFIGINYYTSEIIEFVPRLGAYNNRYFPRQAEKSENGYIANCPEGITNTLKWAKQFDLPIYITGNGIEDSIDRLRPRYLVEHLHQIWRSFVFNTPVKGYFHDSLVDKFEWERGWTQRFGLWNLDPQTQIRTPRPSAELYAEICRENGISSQVVEKFAPQIAEKLFPG